MNMVLAGEQGSRLECFLELEKRRKETSKTVSFSRTSEVSFTNAPLLQNHSYIILPCCTARGFISGGVDIEVQVLAYRWQSLMPWALFRIFIGILHCQSNCISSNVVEHCIADVQNIAPFWGRGISEVTFDRQVTWVCSGARAKSIHQFLSWTRERL